MHFLWPVKGQRKVKKVRAFKELLTNSAPDLIPCCGQHGSAHDGNPDQLL